MGEDTYHLGVKALLRNKDGKILLLRVNTKELIDEDRAYWDIPGGRVKRGDSVEDTLRKEIFEETGITEVSNIKPFTMVLSTIRIPLREGGDIGLILSIYTCNVTSEMEIKLSPEHVESRWFTPAEAADQLHEKYPPEFTDKLRVYVS